MRFRIPRLAFAPVLAIAAGLAFAAPRPAEALTISLDFVTGATTDIFGVGTTTANYAPYGFTSMSTAQIQIALLAAVTGDYLGFPTTGANALSNLPNGKALNINFVMGNSTANPGNGDTEWYFVAIGDITTAGTFLGQACYQCVRKPVLTGPNFGLSNGSLVGSILVDNVAGLAGLAGSDAQRINLLAGTISHEIGHTLGLDHPGSALANPGASSFSLMATGASPTFMPDDQRILDRDFAFSEFDLLISSVGIRDAASVPEPDAMMLFASALLVLAGIRARRLGLLG